MIHALKYPHFFRPTSQPVYPVIQSDPSPSRPTSSGGLKASLGNSRRLPTDSPTPPPATLIQDSSYLEMLNLRLSEAVSKVLATGPGAPHELVGGKRAIPPGRGRALGVLIESELRATQDTPHLHKAILRSLQRPLSVLLSNLSAYLLPLIASPEFYSAPLPSVQNPNPNPTQVHALALAGFVQELLETFDTLDLGKDFEIRNDNLRSIRDGLVSLINRVVKPLVAALHKELIPVLEALNAPSAKPCPNNLHPSIFTLQANVPIFAKALARYTSSPASQATLATFLISIVWRGLVALAHRPHAHTFSSPSPFATRFGIKLPPSRPSSPPPAVSSIIADSRALYQVLDLFPRPKGEKEPTRLAREAVDDAFEGLRALPFLLDAVHSVTMPKTESELNDLASQLETLAAKVPLLIAIPVLLQAPTPKRSAPVTICELIGTADHEYRCQCLSGFGRAEECATAIGLRVLVALRSNPDVHPVVSKWLEIEIEEASQGSSFN